ncbi:YhdH/YhfP family quinone oxidoreductase [Prochlorococcus marinus]|uniref:YhdH/YhfP family quinone oxidoreductase n=1 Tax=Prochlorococcus marinus TaxID=1219 RepID=UPI0022B491C9|nr:YhdH/YhfP family quinone oxidoreductase [Prochlorococcus marinus]
MENKRFKALVVRRSIEKDYSFKLEDKNLSELPDKELLVRVYYSSINYKDGMSCLGNPSITRRYPHTPGVDAVGVVEESNNSEYKIGDKVIVITYPLGMNISGGFGEYIRVPSQWVQKLDFNLNMEEVMAFGTAGFTAALAIYKILNRIDTFNQKDFIVSGVTGGCGSITASILNKLGANVTGVIRQNKLKNDFLEILQLKETIHYDTFINNTKQNLAIPKWDGGFDYVGGIILNSIIKSIRTNGNVTIAGMVNSSSLNTSLLPFFLRGITLYGINAEESSFSLRSEIWHLLSSSWKPNNLNKLYKVVELNDLPETLHEYLEGKVTGRIVIQHEK